MSFPVRPRRPKGETWDQSPQWFVRRLKQTGEFKTFNPFAFKLLAHFCNARNSKDLTPWTNIQDLAELTGASWRRTKKSLTDLLTIGVIRQETNRKEIRFRLVYKDPYAHAHEPETTAGQTPLRPTTAGFKVPGQTTTATATEVDVHLDASVEGRFPSRVYAKTADNSDRIGIQLNPKRQANPDSDPAWPQSWDDVEASPDPIDPRAYTAGEDADSIAKRSPL